MNLATYARRNLFRRRGRTIMTMIAVAVAVLIFSIIRTVVFEFEAGAEAAAKDRIVTRHKVSITMQVPRTYVAEVRNTPGVKAATWANWFGAKDPKERIPFFAGFAADPDTWFDVYDEMQIDPTQLAEWKKPENKNGVIIGDKLAEVFEVKIGDVMHVESDIYPGDWEFKVVGIYKPLRKTVDRNTLILRWDYLNDSPRNNFGHDQVGWMVSRIDDPKRSAEVIRAIDAKFEPKDDQTASMSERAFQLSFLGGFTAVLTAFDYMSLVILLIMVLILANTIAMSVRERTHEYGVLRAIGFPPGHILGFILGESVLVATIGGLIGLGLTMGLINGMMGPFIEENMSSMFPYFSTPTNVMLMGVGAAIVVGVLAGAVPAWRASRLKVTDALRRLD